jgi:uncharacterized protein (TIGR02145 family)
MKRFAILFAALFGAVGAFAQNDTAYVPFVVNVAATVRAVPASGTTAVVTQVQMTVAANTQTTLKIPLPKTLGVMSWAQRLANVPALISNGGGKVTLNLPAQSYKNAEITLYAVNGKRILRKNMSASSAANAISRQNAAPGAYLLSVTGTDGGGFTSRLTHGGGNLDIIVNFGGEKLSSAMKLAKEAAAGDWTVTVSAAGHVDFVYAINPVAGTMPVQNITLRETAPVTPGLGTPANVTASAASATSITVSWSAVSGAVDYYVYRSTSATGTYSRVGNTSATTYTNTGLTTGTTYYYKVSAYNGSTESPQSAYASATANTPIPTVPAVPIGVTAAVESSTSIVVSWTTVSGTTGYYVYRSTSATGTYTKVGDVTSESSSYTNTGLSVGTTYYYKVSAYNGISESSQSSYASAATPLVPLNPPASITAVETSLSAITVSWSAVSGAIGYRVYRGTSVDGGYEHVGTTASTSYTNTGLPINVTYYYWVSVNSNAGEGPVSSSYASAKIDLMPGTFVDYRDDRTYKKITVVGKMWMAENLNYETSSGSWCYAGNANNCTTYGRLYDWTTAMMACPVGWHLPTRQEWNDLQTAVGGSVGKKLKSTGGWEYYEYSTGKFVTSNGTDDYGFTAKPGGYRRSDGGFSGGGCQTTALCNAADGRWWTSEEYYCKWMTTGAGLGDDLHESADTKSSAFSVRCVGD